MKNLLKKLNKNCFFSHSWTKWKQESIKMMYIRDGESYTGYELEQSRSCTECNKMQIEKIR